MHNVANEVTDREVLVCGGVNTTFQYKPGCDTEDIRAEFRDQMELYKNNNMDFVIGEVRVELLYSNQSRDIDAPA